MRETLAKDELFRTAHLVILFVYTLFSLVLIGESLLMGWESWALIPIVGGVVFSWFIHIRHKIPEVTRVWIYSVLIMLTAFFYGIHATSTYDLAVVMCALMMIFILTGIPQLITLAVVTYYITFGYDLYMSVSGGEVINTLFISRAILHVIVVYVIGYVAQVVMKTWDQVRRRTDEKISVLTEATRTMNDFLVNMSHEIRTPVNAVMGLSRVCIENETDENIKYNMVSVERAGKRVAEQISDILDYSEINMKHLVVNEEDYMLSSVLNDLVNQIRPVKPDSLELVIDVDPGLPSVLRGDSGKIKKILWHLIMNGLKYTRQGGVYVRMAAIEEEYGINLCMDVKDTGIGMSPRELERIYDGFYQANSGRTRSTSGLGLGMSIVSGFVSSMNGFVTVDSAPGHGTSVHISIPQKVVDSRVCMSAKNNDKLILGTYLRFEKFSNPNVRDYYNAMIRDIVTGLRVQMHRVETIDKLKRLIDSVQMTHLFVGDVEYKANQEYMEELAQKLLVVVVANDDFTPPEGSGVRVMRKPFYCFPVINILNSDIHTREEENGQLRCDGVRALVVDDEPMNLMVAKGIFARYGMNVDCAESGMQSIELCKENAYDIIFMDHMMPEMDGVEAMKRIRVETGRRDLPIVALTANAVSAAKEMFISEGFDGFVSKPVELEELESVLRKVLPKSMISYGKGPVKNVVDIRGNTGNKPASEGIKENAKKTGYPDEDELTDLGIDVEKGLHYCQNDSEFYKTLLDQFLKDSAKKKKDAAKFLEKGDLKNYSIVVHALKSTAKMIGADDLSSQAKALEDASKEGNDGYVHAHHEDCMKDYTTLTDGLEKLYGSPDEGADDTGGEDDDEIFEFVPEEGGEIS